ncbi:hypothetical protein [Flavisolibacter nicotianae]|uniref:hypothetical protein n=1 Tax=Flavisolibacter nicotianae TaxID=2364882 RepID=UPI000EAF3AC5|nr:hypothetical protein [Flavisolibacter nicotianae]
MNTSALMKTTRLLPLLALFLLASCKKESESLQSEAVSDYLPAQTGKYRIYRLDSTLFTSFGTVTTVRSYQEKHLVDQSITDAAGRPAYRVFRYLRDAAGTEGWQAAGSYAIVPGTASVEVVENNLRFVKLTSPISQDKTWKGNRYLPADPYSAFYGFSNDDNMADWDYTYTGTGETLTLNGQTYNDVLTVQEADESVNAPVTQPSAYGYMNYAVDKYAKGLGLVYQELTMWEYQPNTTSGGNGYKTGFGVKRSLIDHN